MRALGNKYKIGIYGPRNVCSRVYTDNSAVSSFVSDMSTKFSGNLGYPLPVNWAFDQISTITIGSGDGAIEIDNNIQSGKDLGVSRVIRPNTNEEGFLLSDYLVPVKDEVTAIVKEHLSFLQDFKAIRSPESAMDIIFENDELLTQLSQTFGFRKALIQSVLMRELSCEEWEALLPLVQALTPIPTMP